MSETDMTDYAELRAALAAGPAIGPYTVDQDNSDGIVVVDGRGNIVAEANYGDVPTEYGPDITETLIRGVRSTYRYIAAANPVTTTALLAERDALREVLSKILENEASDYKTAEAFGGYVLDDELREEARAVLAKWGQP